MRLAASNIAWEPAEDDAVAAILRGRGFTGVEIAPTKRWPSPLEATKPEIAAYRAEWERRGLEIVAMQALLFGRPDLQLFGSATVRRALREYMIAIIEMAHGLGARALVFGSPKNRKRGSMPIAEATEIATEFFRELGAVAGSRGCVICIEPNPPAYECDFITTTAEAVALCEGIGSRYVKVNGDVGAMVAAGEDVGRTVLEWEGWLGHFHLSEPGLGEVSEEPYQVAAVAGLKGYEGWLSVEMRNAGPVGVGRVADRVSRMVG